MGNAAMPGGVTPDRRTPEQRWRDGMLLVVRGMLAWTPELTHASVTLPAPDGRIVTIYAKRERPGDVAAWMREAPGAEPEEHERPYWVVAEERHEAEAAARPRRRARRPA